MQEYKESEKSRAERIDAAKAEYNDSLREVTSNSKLYLATLNNMCELPYTASECLYLAYHIPGASELDTFENWNQQGYRINKGQKGLTLLEKNKGETVFFDRSQTTAPIATSLNKAQRLPKEKLEALWSCNVRILSATKDEFTKGKRIHFDKDFNAVMINRNAPVPKEQLFYEMSIGIAHAYLFRNDKDAYDQTSYDSIAKAAAYMICQYNDIDCVLPTIPQELSAKEVKEHLENTKSVYQIIQSNIDYYYEHGKPQFEKPKTNIKAAPGKERSESEKNQPQTGMNAPTEDKLQKSVKNQAEKPHHRSIKEILREKKNKYQKLKHEPRHLAKALKKEELTNDKE